MPNKEILIGINSNQDEASFLTPDGGGGSTIWRETPQDRYGARRASPGSILIPPFLFLLEGAEIYRLFLSLSLLLLPGFWGCFGNVDAGQKIASRQKLSDVEKSSRSFFFLSAKTAGQVREYVEALLPLPHYWWFNFGLPRSLDFWFLMLPNAGSTEPNNYSTIRSGTHPPNPANRTKNYKTASFLELNIDFYYFYFFLRSGSVRIVSL